MSDWLDSDEFKKKLNDLLSAVASGEDPYDYYVPLIAAIREHFLPKNKETYDQICDCMDWARAADYDKLRQLVLGEE